MPFVLIFIGLLLTVAGVRNTQSDYNGQPGLFTLLKGDFSGNNSFSNWVVGVVAVGSLGYVKELQKFSNYFLALIFLVLLLAEENANGGGGFFGQFNKAIKRGLTQTPTPPESGINTASVTGATIPEATPGVKPNTRALSGANPVQGILDQVTGSDPNLIASIFGGSQ